MCERCGKIKNVNYISPQFGDGKEGKESMKKLVILAAIRERHINNIMDGRKGIEIRTKIPTRKEAKEIYWYESGTGKVVAKSKLIGAEWINIYEPGNMKMLEDKACVSEKEIFEYSKGKGKIAAWEIKDTQKFDRAIPIEELGIKRAPMSWQYIEIEEVTKDKKRKRVTDGLKEKLKHIECKDGSVYPFLIDKKTIEGIVKNDEVMGMIDRTSMEELTSVKKFEDFKEETQELLEKFFNIALMAAINRGIELENNLTGEEEDPVGKFEFEVICDLLSDEEIKKIGEYMGGIQEMIKEEMEKGER